MPAATPAKRARQRANKVARTAEPTPPKPQIILPPLPTDCQPAPPSPPTDDNRSGNPISLEQLLTTLADRFELQDPEAGPVIAEAFRSGVRGGCTLATQRFKARYDDLDNHVQAFIIDYESRIEELQTVAYQRGVADERARREEEAKANVHHPEPGPSSTTSMEPDEPVPEHDDLGLLSPNQRIVFKRGYEQGYGNGLQFVLGRMAEKNAEAVARAFEEGHKAGWTQAQEGMTEQRQQDTDYAFEKRLEAGRLEAHNRPRGDDNPVPLASPTTPRPSLSPSHPLPISMPTEVTPSPPTPGSPSPEPSPELDSQVVHPPSSITHLIWSEEPIHQSFSHPEPPLSSQYSPRDFSSLRSDSCSNPWSSIHRRTSRSRYPRRRPHDFIRPPRLAHPRLIHRHPSPPCPCITYHTHAMSPFWTFSDWRARVR